MAQNPYSGGTPTVPAEVNQPVDPLQRINVNPDMFGAQVGKSISDVGSSLSDLSQVWGAVQGDAATNNAMTQATATLDHFKSLEGLNALNAQQSTLKNLEQIFQNSRKGLSPRAALQFDESTRRYIWDANSVVSTHADQQGKAYHQQVNDATFNTAMSNIADTAYSNPLMAMWFRERARNATIKNLELAGDGNNLDLRQNAIRASDQASAQAFIGAIEAKNPALALKVANEPQFQKDLGVKYGETVQRLQSRADEASGHGAGAVGIAKAQNDAGNAPPPPTGTAVVQPGKIPPTSEWPPGTAYVAHTSDGRPVYVGKDGQALPDNVQPKATPVSFTTTDLSTASGLDAYKGRVAQIESQGGRDPNAHGNIYQFQPGTWSRLGGGDLGDRALQERRMDQLTVQNREQMTYGLGRPPTPAELYLAHQQGSQGALQLLANPGRRAGDIVGDQAIRGNGGDPNAPASEFTRMWEAKYSRTSYAAVPHGGGESTSSQGGGYASAPIEPPAPDDALIHLASFTSGESPSMPLPGETGQGQPQTSAVAPTQIDPNSTQAMMAAAMKNVNDDPSLSEKAKAVAFDDIRRWGTERDLADEQNQKAVKARSDKAQDHVFNLLNQGDFLGASRQADADAAAGNIDQRELSTLRETIQKRSGQDETISYGRHYTEAFGRVLLPEDNPNKIRTRREIQELELAGDLSPKGSDRLQKVVADKENSLGQAEMEHAALAMAKRNLSYEVDYGTVKIPDPKGDDYINQFTQRFYTSLRDWTAKNNPLEKFPLFNNDEIMKVVNQIRPPSEKERDYVDAQHQQFNGTTGGTPPAQIPPPQGIDGDSWVKVVSAPPMLQTGQRMTTDNWATAISRLQANPSPKALADFEAWFPGQSAQGVLDILGAKAQASEAAPQPEFAPSNLEKPAAPVTNVRTERLQAQHEAHEQKPSVPSRVEDTAAERAIEATDPGAEARRRQYMETHQPALPAKPENVRTRRLREQHEKEGH